jgi:hypothetical protein
MADYDSPLTEEVLRDVAQNFFGTRKKLDDMIEILESFAATLRLKAGRVELHAGVLHFLLVEDDWILRFYAAIGVAQPGDLAECRRPEPLPGLRVPFALTRRGRFVKTVHEQYRRLQHACREYRCSTANPLEEAENPIDACVDVRMLEAMRELINGKIQEVNEQGSPSTVLQYTKGFDAKGERQSKVAGATGGEYSGMDRKYLYRPIPVEQMGLKQYPDLPAPDHCRAAIERFSRKVYPQIAGEVNFRLARLKETGSGT